MEADARVKKWWKEASIYQIYPASFCDTTGSGAGDLNGITSKLPYLKALGMDVVWLSPVYASPMLDMGYDISDYKAIHPSMGTMADWDRMLATAHGLGLKIVMDLVVNHTSWDHEWFKDSLKGGPKRDWYIWRPKNEKTGKEPNNWGSAFSGSAWKWDEASQEYYLHVFDVSQPDLNWENPDVRDAIWDVMRFWMDKGCDGFRMDVINCISKTPGFPDAPIGPDDDWAPGVIHRFNGPKLKDYLLEMHEKVLVDYPDAFTVGETPGIDKPQDACKLIQHGTPLQMLFNFEHMSVDKGPNGTKKEPFPLLDLKAVLGSWFTYMQENDGWDSLYLENHDQPRIVQRWASDAPEHRAQSAKMLGVFHIACKGTLFLFQGQEIGCCNSKSWTREELRDVQEVNLYNTEEAKRPTGADMSDVLAWVQHFGRDNARMPMKWDASSNAGFTTAAEPWIKICEDYEEWNVAAQLGKEDSVLEFWRKLIQIRKDHETLIYGSFEMVDAANEKIYAFTRTGEKDQYLAVCNFTAEEVTWESPAKGAELVISSHPVSDPGSKLTLKPFEGRLYRSTK